MMMLLPRRQMKSLSSSRSSSNGISFLWFVVVVATATTTTFCNAQETIRFGIQKDHGHYHGSRCDSSILGELLKEEIWSWTHDELESVLHRNEIFDLGHVELENVAESYVHLLSNATKSHSGGAAGASAGRGSPNTILLQHHQQNQYQRIEAADHRQLSATSSSPSLASTPCNDQSSLCQRWVAPLSIGMEDIDESTSSSSRTTSFSWSSSSASSSSSSSKPKSPKSKLRGGKSSLMIRIANRLKSVLETNLSEWMIENTVLIGKSCTQEISTLQVSVEIVEED